MAATKSKLSFFDVFPRDLRDQIYESTFDHDIERQRFTFRFQAPCPHLRLISHRFKTEYDEHYESTPRSATLLATGNGANSVLLLPEVNNEDELNMYNGRYERMPKSVTPCISATGGIQSYTAQYDEQYERMHKIAMRSALSKGTTRGAASILGLPARQSIPGLARRCTSLEVTYFMRRPKHFPLDEEMDLTHFVPDIRCLILGLGLQLWQSEVVLVWKSTSAIQTFAIRCELSTPSILSRLRTSRYSHARFRDAFRLLYRGQMRDVRFFHQDFDSCGDFFQDHAIGGTWNHQKGIFKADGRVDEDP